MPNNTCPSAEQLNALLAGSLQEAEHARLAQHLEECAVCQQHLEAGGVYFPLKQAKREEGAPSPLLEQVMANLKADSEHPAKPVADPLLAAGTKLRYFGDYEILEEVGRGGMGVVYRARQVSLNRFVALKLILAGQLASESDVRRFRTEAEAAAMLDHPNIVPIYEIGEHEDRHYFSMKLVEGGNLAERIAGEKGGQGEREKSGVASLASAPFPPVSLSRATSYQPPDAAALLAKIARAVHYAHQRGVLHRDLKPSNILLDAQGQSHLTDFGLAKLLDRDSGLTHSALLMGSPDYIAPELAAGNAKEVTTAADVFSLGAILYELLTGRPPFTSVSVMETLRKVVEEEVPVEPLKRSIIAASRGSTLQRFSASTPSDLITICLKCLEKEPTRRYRSAELLADELDRFARGEPILARPSTSLERVIKWTRRKPALAGSLAALALVSVLGFAGVLWKWRGEVHQRRLAQQESRRAQQANLRFECTLTRLEIERAESLLQVGDSSKGLAYLARLLRQQPTNFVAAERLMSALSYRSFCLPVAPLRHGKSLDSLTGERKAKLARWFAFRYPGSVVTAIFSPDGQRVVTASEDGTARLWNAFDGGPIGEPMRHDAEVLWAEFSRDGQRVVTASVDGTARIWAADTGRLAAPPLRHEDIVHHATFSPDGQKVITASRDKTVRVWSSQSGKPIGEPLIHPGLAYFACFSPDGRRILSADDGPTEDFARLWDAETGAALASAIHFSFSTEPAPFPLFHPSLDQVLTLYWHTAALRSPQTNLTRSALLLHDDFCLGAAYSPDGRRIATVSADTTARLWNPVTGEALIAPLRHNDSVPMADFGAGGQQLLTCSRDKSARLWEVRTGEALAEPMRQDHALLAARLSFDGRRVVTVSETDSAWLWEVRTRHPLVTLRRMRVIPQYARFNPDGQQIVVVDESDHAQVWNTQTGSIQTKAMSHGANTIIKDAQFSPDGRRLLTSAENATIQAWDPLTGEPIGPSWPQRASDSYFRFGPDGSRVATASNDGIARLLDAETGRLVFELRHAGRVYSAEFNADGRLLVTASADGTAQIWDVATGKPTGPPLKHDSDVHWAEFDRAAQRVATASKDKTVRLWSVQTGQPVTPSLVHADALNRKRAVAFSLDGSRLATMAGNSVQVWNPATGHAVTTPLRHGGLVRAVLFSPDGRKLLTASEDGTARFWDPETGHPVSEPMRHGARVTSAEFSPDGTRVVTTSADMAVRVWEVTSAPLPVPEWLPALAEAVAGQSINSEEVSTVVSVEELYRLRQKLAANTGSSHYERWARWFFADGASRTISPSSETSVPEYVQRWLEDNTRESLQEATLLSATNALAFARLAENLSVVQKSGPHRARAFPEDADWFSRYATNLAPGDPEILRIRNLVLDRLQQSKASSKP